MKSILRIFLSAILCCLFFASCGDKNEEVIDEETPWNKSRTANILIYSNLSGGSLLSNSNDYNKIVSDIKITEHAVAMLDKSNVVYGETAMTNMGVKVASQSKSIPLFVPSNKNSTGYEGSTVLLSHTFNKMKQSLITDNCRMMMIDTYAMNNIPMTFATASFSENSQIEASTEILKNTFQSASFIIGVVKRSLVASLESRISTALGSSTYSFSKINNANQNSEYCIYLLSSSKWKFRELVETSVSGDVKSFQIKVESLK